MRVVRVSTAGVELEFVVVGSGVVWVGGRGESDVVEWIDSSTLQASGVSTVVK